VLNRGREEKHINKKSLQKAKEAKRGGIYLTKLS